MLSGSAPATTTCSPSAPRRCIACSSVECLGERILLTRGPRRSGLRASSAARLHPAQRPHDLAPGHLERFPAPQLPGDDAPAHEQLLRHRLASASLPGRSTPSSTAGAPRTSARAAATSGLRRCPSPPGARRRASARRSATVRVRHRSRAESRARTAEKASAGDEARETRSHRPSSTSAGSRPVRGASSGRKQAPRDRNAARTSAAAPTSGSGAGAPLARRAAWPRAPRARTKASGVAGEGVPLRPVRSARGVRRPQTISPDRHSSSSQRGS